MTVTLTEEQIEELMIPPDKVKVEFNASKPESSEKIITIRCTNDDYEAFKSTMITAAPASANVLQNSAPSSPTPPVTTATRPVKSNFSCTVIVSLYGPAV